MGLPVLPIQADIRNVVERVNPLIRFYNRPDLFVPSYAADTGSGTAYAIAPSPDITQYLVGQIFVFKALNTLLTTTPTLNVNGLGAGTISSFGGFQLGDIAAGQYYMVLVTSVAPTFLMLSNPTLTGAGIKNLATQTFLGSDIGLSNIAAFFSGPNTGSIGLSGQTWEITATALMSDTAGAALLEASIFDGTNYVVSGTARAAVANENVQVSLTYVVNLGAAMTFTLRAKDLTSTNGLLLTTGNTTGGTNNATSITAVRIS